MFLKEYSSNLLNSCLLRTSVANMQLLQVLLFPRNSIEKTEAMDLKLTFLEVCYIGVICWIQINV